MSCLWCVVSYFPCVDTFVNKRVGVNGRGSGCNCQVFRSVVDRTPGGRVEHATHCIIPSHIASVGGCVLLLVLG